MILYRVRVFDRAGYDQRTWFPTSASAATFHVEQLRTRDGAYVTTTRFTLPRSTRKDICDFINTHTKEGTQ